MAIQNMTTPSRNLAAINYLHSNKVNFFNNLVNYKINERLQYQHMIDSAIDKLDKDLMIAKAQEAEFYEDFSFEGEKKITTPQEWSRRFLRIGKDDMVGEKNDKDNKIAILTNIFHDRRLYNILSEHTYNPQKIKKLLKKVNFSNYGFTDKDVQEIMKSITNEAELTLGTIFTKFNLFDKNTTVQKDFLEELTENLGSTVKNAVNNIGGKLSKETSTKLKNITRLITTTRLSPKKKLEQSTIFIENSMRKTNIFSDEEITSVLDMWETLFRRDLAGKDKRLISDSIEKVEGRVQEVERVITLSSVFLKFSFDFYEGLTEQEIIDDYTIIGKNDVKYQTLVKNTGEKMVARLRKNEKNEKGEYKREQGESKIDSVFRGKSGRFWHIQEKNSINEMYEQFDSSGDPNNLPIRPSQIKLQSEVSFSAIQQYFMEGGIFTPEEMQYLIYLLINYNALNIWSAGGKLYKANPNKKKKDSDEKPTDIKAAFTQSLIDGIISSGVKVFISDLIIPDKTQTAIDFENWNFIIFRGQMLIPLSYIITYLLQYLRDAKNNIMVMRTYSKLEGIGVSYLKDIYTQKLEAIKKEDGGEKDYHLQELIDIGTGAGKDVEEALKIKSIYLKFNAQAVNNLINPNIF